MDTKRAQGLSRGSDLYDTKMAATDRSVPIIDDNLPSPRDGNGIRRRCWNALSVISFSQGVITICVFVLSTEDERRATTNGRPTGGPENPHLPVTQRDHGTVRFRCLHLHDSHERAGGDGERERE